MKREEVASFYKDLSSYAGKTVTVCGWARSIRDSKTLGFIDLNDGTSFKGVQVVFEDGKIDNFKEIASQNVGAALCVTGTLLATPEAKQPFEIHAQKNCCGRAFLSGISFAEETPYGRVPSDYCSSPTPYEPV